MLAIFIKVITLDQILEVLVFHKKPEPLLHLGVIFQEVHLRDDLYGLGESEMMEVTLI